MKLIGIARDLGHAVRTLRREPGFALPAILILGLGLGGTAAVFSLEPIVESVGVTVNAAGATRSSVAVACT